MQTLQLRQRNKYFSKQWCRMLVAHLVRCGVNCHACQKRVEPSLLEKQHCPCKRYHKQNAYGIGKECFEWRCHVGYAVHRRHDAGCQMPFILVDKNLKTLNACTDLRPSRNAVHDVHSAVDTQRTSLCALCIFETLCSLVRCTRMRVKQVTAVCNAACARTCCKLCAKARRQLLSLGHCTSHGALQRQQPP